MQSHLVRGILTECQVEDMADYGKGLSVRKQSRWTVAHVVLGNDGSADLDWPLSYLSTSSGANKLYSCDAMARPMHTFGQQVLARG